jgi:hypothetical protein
MCAGQFVYGDANFKHSLRSVYSELFCEASDASSAK